MGLTSQKQIPDNQTKRRVKDVLRALALAAAAAPAGRAVKQRKRNKAVFVSRSPNLLYHDDELINTLYQNGLEMAKVVIVNYVRSGR